MTDGADARQLVVIGAPAGGEDALSTLVGTLAPDFAAPIVVAQQHDTSRPSHLQEILVQRATLPVRTVHNGEQLQKGIIYVAPADRHVEITQHGVSLLQEPGGGGGPVPWIDLLLASAADVYGDQLIAVILTGPGSDGVGGARRVKEMGGTVVIQNSRTAPHLGMPLSLAPTTVDIVAELEAIGPLLADLLSGTYTRGQPGDERRLRSVLEQVRARIGLDFSSYKEPTIRRRLQRRMLDTNCETLEDYVRYLRGHPEEYDRLANSFLIKVTDFFRDADLFNHLREQVLPSLIEEARSHGNELRLWSAGCATGEEAYSLAILVSELLGVDLEKFTVRIFATDLDSAAVAFARRGIYPSSAVESVPPELRDRYLLRLDSAWEVRTAIRSQVVFGQHDLGRRAPFPRIDLVLCRNVLLYFTPDLQRRVLQLFAFGLREGGYLVLGKSETASPLPEHFTLVQPRLKIFRRQGSRVVIPASRIRDVQSMATAAIPARPELSDMERQLARAHARRVGGASSSERAEQIMTELPIGVVVVDRNYDIASINATARRLLGIHAPAIGDDVVHLAHRSLGDALRDAVDAAFAGRSRTEVHELVSVPDTPGAPRHFEISAFLAQHDVASDSPQLAVLTIVDVSERERELRRQREELAAARSEAHRLQELLDQTHSVRQLLEANQALSVANSGLRTANEDLLVGSEEAMAAMEEIETLNEEQQATNEELESLNEELQATVEELNATNEDLQARTLELQDQAATQEALMMALREERERAQAILSNMSDAVMLVGANGDVLLTNSAFEQLFGAGLPLLEDASGQPLRENADVLTRSARGETFTQSFTVAAPDGIRRWFEARGQPTRVDGIVTGGVVVIRDVSERSLRRLHDEFVALAGHELRTPLTALHGALQLAERALGADGDRRVGRYVTTGIQQARLLGELVQDLTDVVRVQTGQLTLRRQRIDLAEETQHAVELGRTMANDQEIRLDIADPPLYVNADARRLQQVILNLLSNAVQHGASSLGVDVRVGREGAAAALQVRDYGPGIAPEQRDHIFERFYQADSRPRSGGLGLGLYLVQAIISAHDGTVHAEPNNPTGTTFVVRLPLLDHP